MIAVPRDMPVTIPVEGSMSATDGSLLIHAPPLSVLVSVVVNPLHTASVPAIGGGVALMVAIADTVQPNGEV